MFRFEKEQSVLDFNGIKLGGQPGEYPRVLGASIFYNKQEIVLDDHTGKIDREKAEALWNRTQELYDLTGNPFFCQIISEHGEAFENYFQWFDSIDNKTPFLMDSSDPAALAHATQFVDEIGLADRAIYNSINGSITPENIEVLKNSSVNSAIVLAFNPGDGTVIGKEKVLNEGGVAELEKISAEVGFEQVVYDDHVGKVSLVGAGMRSHPGVTATFCEALSDAGVNIEIINTSEIRISVLVRDTQLADAVSALHAAFELGGEEEAVGYAGGGR